MRISLLFVVAVVAIYVFATPTNATMASPVDINDPYIQRIGRWAVTEHVKQTNDNIKFTKVVSGRKDRTLGINYDLIIDASNSKGKNEKYEAELYQLDRGDKLSLLSFSSAD